MDDRLKEECGIFGVYNHPEASALVALGLHALQHRGQEACGINSFDGKNFYSIKRRGLVGDNFTDPKIIDQLKGNSAIGHNRYHFRLRYIFFNFVYYITDYQRVKKNY